MHHDADSTHHDAWGAQMVHDGWRQGKQHRAHQHFFARTEKRVKIILIL